MVTKETKDRPCTGWDSTVVGHGYVHGRLCVLFLLSELPLVLDRGRETLGESATVKRAVNCAFVVSVLPVLQALWFLFFSWVTF